MPPSPRVSVVIPAYNVAGVIAETLDSVLAQTFHDYEIVVVNDGSPDTAELEDVLASYWDAIVYLKQENGGTAKARNTGIQEARGELIAFLDGDDIWLPEYLREQLTVMNAGNLAMVYSNALLFGPGRSKPETYMRRAPSDGPADFEAIISGRCNVMTSGTLVYRQTLIEAGLFDTALPRIGMEDFDLWLRLARAGVRIGYHRKCLLKYRVSPAGLSGNSIQRASRQVVGLLILRGKLDLTAREAKVWRETLDHAHAELFLEIGKVHLLREEFADARESFRAANGHYRSLKLNVVTLALTLFPRMVVRLFKSWRADDLPFIRTVDF